MNQLLNLHQNAITQLCERHGVQQLYVFGSVLREDFDRNEESDVDFLVEMQPNLAPLDRGERLLQLWFELEQLLNRKVDLLTTQSLKNPYLVASIDQNKRLIYDREHAETLV